MADRLRLALVGCGGMMGAHVKSGFGPLWQKGYRQFEIVACCDTVAEAAGRLAQEVAAWQGSAPRVFAGVGPLLEEAGSFDAADISVPHREHHAAALPLLKAGKPVLIEKPLALTLRTGRMMIEAAGQAGVLLAVAENYRRDLGPRTMNWVIRSGRLGRLRQMYWLDCKERLRHWGWRDDLDAAGGGWTLDGGVHYADLMRYHLGPVRRVTSLSRQYDTARYRDAEKREGMLRATIEDTTMALLEFESGVSGMWVESIVSPGRRCGMQLLYGESGSLHFDEGLQLRGEKEPVAIASLQQSFLEQLDEAAKERLFPFGLQDGVAQEIREFVEACLHGGSVETDGEEGYKAQAVCMAVYESAALGGRPVTMAEVEALEVEAYQRPLNASIGL